MVREHGASMPSVDACIVTLKENRIDPAAEMKTCSNHHHTHLNDDRLVGCRVRKYLLVVGDLQGKTKEQGANVSIAVLMWTRTHASTRIDSVLGVSMHDQA